MSRRNGDRSRFNRLRKQKIQRRTVSAALVPTTAGSKTEEKASKASTKTRKA